MSRAFAATVALVSLVSSGCPAAARPLATHIVCEHLGDTGECSPDERERACAAWANDAVTNSRNGNFRIWPACTSNEPCAVLFEAAIPSSWGSGVKRRKLRFIELACNVGARSLSDEQLRKEFGPGVNWPDPEVVLRALDGPEGWQRATHPESLCRDKRVLHERVLCDTSPSDHDVACTKKNLLRAFDSWASSGGACEGSTFIVTLIGAAAQSTTLILEHETLHVDSGRLLAELIGTRRAIADKDIKEGGSAVAEAIAEAAGFLREQDGYRRLTIISDGYQVSRNIRVLPVSPNALRRALEQSRLWRDLTGVEVVMCGGYDGRLPRPHDRGDPSAEEVQAAWTAALAAMNADSWGYKLDCRNALQRPAPGGPQRIVTGATCATALPVRP